MRIGNQCGGRKESCKQKVNYQTYAAELDKTAYSGSDLGAVWSEDSTTFKVWAPKAATVKLNLYEHGSDEEGDGGSIATKQWSLTKNRHMEHKSKR